MTEVSGRAKTEDQVFQAYTSATTPHFPVEIHFPLSFSLPVFHFLHGEVQLNLKLSMLNGQLEQQWENVCEVTLSDSKHHLVIHTQPINFSRTPCVVSS